MEQERVMKIITIIIAPIMGLMAGGCEAPLQQRPHYQLLPIKKDPIFSQNGIIIPPLPDRIQVIPPFPYDTP